MRLNRKIGRLARWIAFGALTIAATAAAGRAQDQKPGELRFTADTSTERDAGVWIDGKYVGYLKELHGDKKVLLPPGDHEVTVREAGYKDFTQKVTMHPGEVQLMMVMLTESEKVIYPGNNAAELRLDVKPKQAAVYVDDQYMGHGADFGGRFHSMLLIPGKHHVRIVQPGYQTWEMDLTVDANVKSQLKADLMPCAVGTECK